MSNPIRRQLKSGKSPAKLVAAVITGAIVLGGCFTGERPSFDSEDPLQTESGDEAVDVILERLDAVAPAQFTAEYEILTRLGAVDSEATVVQADNSRRSITINDVRFIDSADTIATCDLESGECEATLNDARISDLLLSHEFYAKSFARRLRVDANRRIGDTNGYTITQADQQVLCVDVPITGGTVTYCALDSGPLARYDGNDLFIQMTSITDVPDETKFATS